MSDDYPVLNSVQDFLHPRSRRLIEMYSLDIREIIERYLDFGQEFTEIEELPLGETDEESFDKIIHYLRGFVSHAIIYYEISRREGFVLPINYNGYKDATIERTDPTEAYEIAAQQCEENIAILEKEKLNRLNMSTN